MRLVEVASGGGRGFLNRGSKLRPSAAESIQRECNYNQTVCQDGLKDRPSAESTPCSILERLRLRGGCAAES